MKIKLSFGAAFVLSTIIYLVASLFYTLFSIPFTEIIGVILVLTVIVKIFFLSNIEAFLVICLFFLFLISTCFLLNKDFVDVQIFGLKDSFRFFFSVLLIITCYDNRFIKSILNFMRRNYQHIYYFLLSLSILNIYFLTQNNCYSSNWGGSYFIAYSFSNHSCASSLCLLMSLKLLCLPCFKKVTLIDLSFLVLDFFMILQTGSRTFVIPSFVVLILSFRFLRLDIISSYFKYIIFCFLPIVILQSKFISKLSSSVSEDFFVEKYGLIDTFSNARLRIWNHNLKSYFEGNWFNIFIGNGFDFSYIVNNSFLGMKIWAHSDFVSVLVSLGIFGFLLYLIAYITLVSKIKNKTCICLICAYTLFPMFFNGFFLYQHLLFSFVFVYCFITNYEKKLVPCSSFLKSSFYQTSISTLR